jgi:hypothetical protein
VSEIVPAHVQTRTFTETVWYPDHLPRRASPEYRATHKHLVYELDEACWICGVRQSQLPKGEVNETHHYWLEWALANGVDKAIIRAYMEPWGITHRGSDDEWLRWFLDSEGNMLVLCSAHHRHGLVGIHMVTYPAWVEQKWRGGQPPASPSQPS